MPLAPSTPTPRLRPAEPSEAARASLLRQARRATATAVAGAVPTGTAAARRVAPHPLPTISVATQLRQVIADAWRAVTARRDTYATAGGWGYISPPADARAPDAIHIAHFTPATATAILADVADWYDAVGHDAYPPERLAKIMCDKPESVPRLDGILHAPYLRRDGAIILSPGYDPTSRKYLSLPPGWAIPSLPTRPTPADVKAAVRLLGDELLCDFPFARESDKAHAFSELLTPVVRDYIDGATPLHLNEAPQQGTGKGLLAEVAVRVATGTMPESAQYVTDEAEMQKTLVATLLQGPSVVLLDNLAGTIESAALATALTEPIYRGRLLGESRMLRLPISGVTWIATGNNCTLGSDYPRRTIHVRLDARTDQPHLRTGFRHALPKWAVEHRAELIHALLILVRAWQTAGCPAGQRTRGRYESWAATIGGILQIADIPGFLDPGADPMDDETSEWRALTDAWWAEYAGNNITPAKLVQVALRAGLLTSLLASAKGELGQASKMGKALQQRRDRVFGDYTILAQDARNRRGQQEYYLRLRGVSP